MVGGPCPNYLWAGGVLAGDVDQGLFRIARVLDAIEEARKAAGEADHESVDGGLIAFEAVPAEVRPQVLQALKDTRLSGVAAPEGFVHAIRMYPDAPGSWLAELAPHPDHIDPGIAETYLARSIATIANGSSPGGTAVKATAFRQVIESGRIRFSRDAGAPVEELKRYPMGLTPDERSMVESFMRASFGSFQGLPDPAVKERAAWAKRFWNANWALYRCKVRADAEDQADVPVESGAGEPRVEVEREVSERDGNTGGDDHVSESDDFGHQIAEVWDDFMTTAVEADPQLYDPGRYEVLSGLAAHALRLTLAVAAHPGLWVGEFSAPLLRSVAEILIDLAWFGTDEGRTRDAHQRFKEFGRGRLKLAMLHAEEYADRFEANPLLDEVLEVLGDEVNREIGEEFQDISLEATFTGRDLRKMALASNSEWVYKLQLAPMSSVVHSEWPMLTRYAMQLCINPVHRLHWLPRTTLVPAVRPVAGQTAVVMARDILRSYRAALNEPEPRSA